MRHHLKTLIALFIGVFIMSSSSWSADLREYRWKNRLLLVFSPTASDPVYASFAEDVSSRSNDVKDRDLVVFKVFEKGTSRLEGQPLSQEDARNLRRRFRVKAGRFTVILIGKDGGVKMVREDQAELQEVFDLIDSMPMRQWEMREKGRMQ
jgi:hypothetical protein